MDGGYTIEYGNDRRRPKHYPEGFRFSFERHVREEIGEYDLDALDDGLVKNMVRFVRDGYEPYFSPETFEKILLRSRSNNCCETLPGR